MMETVTGPVPPKPESGAWEQAQTKLRMDALEFAKIRFQNDYGLGKGYSGCFQKWMKKIIKTTG